MKFINNINLQNKKKLFIYIFISFIISLSIVKISESREIWFNFWLYFNQGSYNCSNPTFLLFKYLIYDQV